MILQAFLKKKLGFGKSQKARTTESACGNIYVQRKSKLLSLGVRALSIGAVKNSASKPLVLGHQAGAFRDLKLTTPAGMLGVWCSTRNLEDSDISLSSPRC